MSSENRDKKSFHRPGGMHGGGPGGALGMPVQKAKDFKGTLKRLLRRLVPFKVNLAIVLVLAVASTVFAVFAPKISGKAITKIYNGVIAGKVLSQMENTQEKALEYINLQMAPGTSTQSFDNVKEMPDPELINAVNEFMALPRLSTLKDPDLKADVCEKIISLGAVIQPLRDGVEIPDTLTQEQITGAIAAIRETGGNVDFEYVGSIILLLIGIYLFSSSFSAVSGLVMSGVAQKTVYGLRKELDYKLSKLPLKYFDSRTHGEILSRVTNDIDTIAATLQQSVTQIITSAVQILGFIVMMLTISPLLTLIVVTTLPMYGLITAGIAKRSQKFFAKQQKELGMLSGHVEEMYTGHEIVKAFNREKDSIEKFKAINNNLYESAWKAQFISGIMFPVMNFISNLGYVLICVVGGLWITKNRLQMGDITAFIQYSRQFTMPIIQTANIANIIQSTIACAERVFEVMDEEEELPDNKDAEVLEEVKGEVRFKDLSFRYKEEVPLIEDLNIDIKKGQTIAIVGPTGAGKTTLVNLLMRFYELNQGRITIDGADIRNLKRGSLRTLFGMVLQDTWLFNGTIRQNIAYGKEAASNLK